MCWTVLIHREPLHSSNCFVLFQRLQVREVSLHYTHLFIRRDDTRIRWEGQIQEKKSIITVAWCWRLSRKLHYLDAIFWYANDLTFHWLSAMGEEDMAKQIDTDVQVYVFDYECWAHSVGYRTDFLKAQLCCSKILKSFSKGKRACDTIQTNPPKSFWNAALQPY
jgi:hypothetical protein